MLEIIWTLDRSAVGSANVFMLQHAKNIIIVERKDLNWARGDIIGLTFFEGQAMTQRILTHKVLSRRI